MLVDCLHDGPALVSTTRTSPSEAGRSCAAVARTSCLPGESEAADLARENPVPEYGPHDEISGSRSVQSRIGLA